MKAYLALFCVRASALFQYRIAAIAGLFTQMFWGLIYTLVLIAFYREGAQLSTLSLDTAISFIWISQAFWLLVPWNVDKHIESQIVTGQIAYELIRPMNLYWLWLSRCLALRAVPSVMRSIPIFMIAGLFLGLQAPVSVAAFVCFLFSVVFSILLSASITTTVLISLFWTISGEGLLRLLPCVAVFFSGLVVPLPLFPEWLQPILLTQPFRFVVDVPARLYTGVVSVNDFWFYAALQLGWAFFFIVMGRYLLERGLRKVVINGG